MTTSRTPSRRITQRRIAELAGVSQATVSLVLNDKADGAARIPEETRERVLKVLRETGYVADPAARRLAGVGNKILGVFTYEPAFPTESQDFYAPAAERHRAGRRGARLRPAALHERARGERLAPALPRAQPPAPRRRMPPARCRDGPHRARAPRRRRIPVRRGRPSRCRRGPLRRHRLRERHGRPGRPGVGAGAPALRLSPRRQPRRVGARPPRRRRRRARAPRRGIRRAAPARHPLARRRPRARLGRDPRLGRDGRRRRAVGVGGAPARARRARGRGGARAGSA